MYLQLILICLICIFVYIKCIKDMQTIQVKGKPYVPVHERVKYLAAHYPHRYSMDTDYDYFPERKLWVVKAILTLTDEKGNIQSYFGLAQELESDDYKKVNATSALENAETSAIGRACAAAGIGISTGYASADEVQKAHNREAATRKESKSVPATQPAIKPAPTQQVASLSTEDEATRAANMQATVKQKTEILLLLNRPGVSKEEKNKMIARINTLNRERADIAIQNLEERINNFQPVEA